MVFQANVESRRPAANDRRAELVAGRACGSIRAVGQPGTAAPSDAANAAASGTQGQGASLRSRRVTCCGTIGREAPWTEGVCCFQSVNRCAPGTPQPTSTKPTPASAGISLSSCCPEAETVARRNGRKQKENPCLESTKYVVQHEWEGSPVVPKASRLHANAGGRFSKSPRLPGCVPARCRCPSAAATSSCWGCCSSARSSCD